MFSRKREWKNKVFISMIIAVLVVSMLITGLGASISAEPEPGEPIQPEEEVEVVTLHGMNDEAAEKIVELGIDISAVFEHDGEIEVEAVVTPSEIEMLEGLGLEVKEAVWVEQEEFSAKDEGESFGIQSVHSADNVQILRADHYTNQAATFLYVEAKSDVGASAGTTLTASWEENGEERTAILSRRTDYGEYLYHWFELTVDEVPETVKIESNQGGSATSEVTEWLGDNREPKDYYVTEFVDSYMTPTEMDERMDQLAEEFPELVDIVELPHKTNGYRRHAQATMGTLTNNAVVVTSTAWGHEGGNDLTVEFVDPATENAPLEVSVDGDTITVQLATNSSGDTISTARQVVDALNAEAGELVSANTYRGNSGGGTALTWEANLTDNLSAPDYVSREPATVRMLSIGKTRDGSKPAVLGYAKEHPREWVTSLVTIEAAERLLRNYEHDEDTRKLVDNLEILIIPIVNPDGTNYSFYDRNMQRRNMTNYCGPTEANDPGARGNWGVDLNRNHTVGTIWDGYVGASTSCTSDTFAGPEPHSEPEARNLAWIADEYDNLTFAMNIHSHGGYFLWSPGAYDTNRVTLPRPTAGEEEYYWQSSEHILNRIQDHRGTVIRPTRTGPIPDVLYSAAGNSGDFFWYEHGVYTWNFEVGAQLWDGSRWIATGFQPDYESEGHDQAMEFANGLIGMFEVAYEHAMNDTRPKSKAVPGSGRYSEPVEVAFETSEPATIYYTLDGSRPTFDSPTLQLAGVRESAETLLIEETTTIKFFSVDVAGNVEKNYKPDGNGRNYNSVTIQIGDDSHPGKGRGRGK